MPLTNDASHRSWIALYRPAIRLSRLQRRERLSDSFFEINKKLCREKHSKLIGFETIFISYYIPLLFFFSFFFFYAQLTENNAAISFDSNRKFSRIFSTLFLPEFLKFRRKLYSQWKRARIYRRANLFQARLWNFCPTELGQHLEFPASIFLYNFIE